MITETLFVDDFDDRELPRYERMSRAEIDNELAKLGIDPQEAIARVKELVEQRLASSYRPSKRQ